MDEISRSKKPLLTYDEHAQSAEVNLLRQRYFVFVLHLLICDYLRTHPLMEG